MFWLICSFMIPMSMITFGKRWSKKPPKDRFGRIGYSTKFSRINDEVFQYANKYWGKIASVTGIWMGLITVCILIFLKRNDLLMLHTLVIIFVQIITLSITFFLTERELRKCFTEDGKRR